MEEFGFPIYYKPRNKTLLEFCRSKHITHREIAEIVGKDEDDKEKWKRKIDRFCSITNPQEIKDKDWNAIENAMVKLNNIDRSVII